MTWLKPMKVSHPIVKSVIASFRETFRCMGVRIVMVPQRQKPSEEQVTRRQPTTQGSGIHSFEASQTGSRLTL